MWVGVCVLFLVCFVVVVAVCFCLCVLFVCVGGGGDYNFTRFHWLVPCFFTATRRHTSIQASSLLGSTMTLCFVSARVTPGRAALATVLPQSLACLAGY